MAQGQRSMPILPVTDVAATSAFFADGLGFNLAGSWENDDGSINFAIVQMDAITIGLAYNADAVGTGENWASYFYLSDIAAFADHVVGNGVLLAREIVDQPYGCRDLEILDPDGNRLCFAQDMSPTAAGPGL